MTTGLNNMRKVLSIFLLFPFALGAAAQSEGGVWLGAEADYDITSRLGAELSVGTRVEDNFSLFDRYDVGLAFSYKPLRWLKLSIGRDFARDYSPATSEIDFEKEDTPPYGYRTDSEGNPVVNGVNRQSEYWRSKHRYNFDLTEKWKIGRFTFSLRERELLSYNSAVKCEELKYRKELDEDEVEDFVPGVVPPEGAASVEVFQHPFYGYDCYYGFKRVDTKKKVAKWRHSFRTRLGIEYNIRHCPVTPFVSYEISNDLADGFAIERHRVMGGIDWVFTRDKRHAFEFAYLYQHGAKEETGNADLHIINIGYKFNFESALAKRQKKAAKEARKISK